jgi:hypothetical protein
LFILLLSPLNARGDEGGLLFSSNIPHQKSQIGYRFLTPPDLPLVRGG